MTSISRVKVAKYLAAADDRTLTTRGRGRALEDLVEYLFSSIPGLGQPTRNQISGGDANEVDVAFANAMHRQGLPQHPAHILIECKNHRDPASAKDVGWFDYNLYVRGLTFGVFIAMGGISGTATRYSSAHQILRQALQAGRRIIVLTRADLEAIHTGAQLVTLLKTKETELVVRQTLSHISGAEVANQIRARIANAPQPARVV